MRTLVLLAALQARPACVQSEGVLHHRSVVSRRYGRPTFRCGVLVSGRRWS